MAAAHQFERLGAMPWHVAAARQCRDLGLRVHVPRRAGAGLNQAELAVARLVCEGWSNRQVAAELSYSVKRIEALLTAIFRKLGVHNRYELIAHHREHPEEFAGE